MSEETKMTTDQKVDELKSLIHQTATVVETELKDSAETKQKLAKMGEDITNLTRDVNEFKTIQTQMLEKVTDEDDKKMKIFDLALKKSEMFSRWGYDNNPINKAMYKPRTEITKSGYVLKGSYDGLEDIMLMNDACFILGLAKAQNDGNLHKYAEYVKESDTYKLLKCELAGNKAFSKALNTTEGADWVPTAMSAQMIDDMRLALKVAAQFPLITMPVRSGSFDVPNIGSRRSAYLISESTSDSSDKIATGTPPSGKTTFQAVKHALRMLVSYEMEEDAIVSMIPLMRREITQALADAEENAIINGDNSATHFDTGHVIGATDVRKSFKGLRYYSNPTNGKARVDIATLNTTSLRSIRKEMGRFGGQNMNDMFWLTSISGYIQMMNNTDVLTFDKYGNMFTLNSGELGRFDGSPVIVSEFIPQDLNATGIYDGVTETKTVIMLVSKNAFWRAYKGSMLAEQERDIDVQQHKVVMSHRLDYKRVWTNGSDEDVVGCGYNLAS
jgi:HK97 family phage major capsid protein